MNVLHYLPYVLLFAAATAIIYAWGLWRTQQQGRDLAQLLSAKGVSAVRRALRKRGPMTRKELEAVVTGLTAGQPFSRKRLAVTEPGPFLDSLLPYMLTQRLITEEMQGKKHVYLYRK